MADKNTDSAVADAREAVAAHIEQGTAPTAPRRNINVDVHMGAAAQRPFAALEDFLAFKSRWGSYEEMQSAEKASLGDAATMEKLDNGAWVRYVEEHVPGGVVLGADGNAYERKRRVARQVALSNDEAHQRRADYFDGSSWVRNGEKREKERVLLTAERGQVDEFLVPAGAETQATTREAAQRRYADTPMPPTAPAGLKVRAEGGKKSDEKEG